MSEAFQRLLRNLYEVTPKAVLTTTVGILPILYRLGTGNSRVPGFIPNPTFTSWIPTNIMEQLTTGALFPATIGALVGSKIMPSIIGKEYTGFKGYLNYAVPAIVSSLIWGGVGAFGRYVGIEDFERPGLIPFDVIVASTLSTFYAAAIDNPRRVVRYIRGLGR